MRRNALRKREQGLAMLLVLGLLAALMIGSAAFYGLLHLTLSQSQTRDRHWVCLNLAEAGLDKSIAELRQHPSEYRGEQDTALDRGFFTVDVRPAKTARAYRVTSTGMLRYGSFVLRRARIVAEVSLAADGGVKALRWSEEQP